jgi:DUF4097 and DUF4098 domain-containing protein YvlB
MAAMLPAAAEGYDPNGSIRIRDGEVREQDFSALNGGITVGDGATVRGKCDTVNGSIEIGSSARVGSLSSVNGGISIGDESEVDGEAGTVNGSISLGRATRAQAVSTVNGGIRLDGAQVSGDVRTVNGDVTLRDGATVGGNIVIDRRGDRHSRSSRPLRIELDGGSVVEGDVIVEGTTKTKVELYLRGGSKVLGKTESVEVMKE